MSFHEDKSLTPPTDYKLATLCEYFGVRLKAIARRLKIRVRQAGDATTCVFFLPVPIVRSLRMSRHPGRTELVGVSPLVIVELMFAAMLGCCGGSPKTPT